MFVLIIIVVFLYCFAGQFECLGTIAAVGVGVFEQRIGIVLLIFYLFMLNDDIQCYDIDRV